LRKAAGQFIESESSEEFATQLQKIDDRIRSSLIKLFNDRKTDVTEILVCESNNISRTNLKDFDWSVKVNFCWMFFKRAENKIFLKFVASIMQR